VNADGRWSIVTVAIRCVLFILSFPISFLFCSFLARAFSSGQLHFAKTHPILFLVVVLNILDYAGRWHAMHDGRPRHR
jgi:uncharacterized membrane-anchored protein